MKRFIPVIAIAVLLVATLHGPASAGGLTAAGELEAARANARAGGPTSEREAELLRRHGCLSGTNSDFCRQLEGRAPSTPPRRAARKSRH